MINLDSNKSNIVVLTLDEKLTLTGTTAQTLSYYFVFTQDGNNYSKTFFADDISTSPCRYNEFEITTTGSTFENLSGGTISLDNDGWYRYEVYGTYEDKVIPFTSNNKELLEKGNVKYNITEINLPKFDNVQETKVYKKFNYDK